jgi:hypothetical protein
MSCGLKSEWFDKHIKSSITPMEILALQWKVSTLRWKASIYSDGNTKVLRWKITPHSLISPSNHQSLRWKPSTHSDGKLLLTITPSPQNLQTTHKRVLFFYKLFGGVLYSDCEWQPHSYTRNTYVAGRDDRRG